MYLFQTNIKHLNLKGILNPDQEGLSFIKDYFTDLIFINTVIYHLRPPKSRIFGT